MAYVRSLLTKEEIDELLSTKKENNMNNQPKRHNILFLAPSIEYARTVVKNLSHFLHRNNIQYGAFYEHTAPCVYTDFAAVEFLWDDPIDWKPGDFCKKDAVFGKKELVQKAREKFGCQYHIHTPKMCLDNYLMSLVSESTDCIAPEQPTIYIPAIKKVHFNDPMTIVIWEDGTKTVVKCQDGDIYSKETGLALCIAKKAFGNKGNFNEVFKKWIPEEEKYTIYTNREITNEITRRNDSLRHLRDTLTDAIYQAMDAYKKEKSE